MKRKKFELKQEEIEQKEMDPDEMDYILYEMFGVDNDDDLEYAIDCWDND